MTATTQLEVSPLDIHTTVGQDSEESDIDSLFDSSSPVEKYFPSLYPADTDIPTRPIPLPPPIQQPPHSNLDPNLKIRLAQRTCPPIPGLFFTPSLTIPKLLADTLMSHSQRYFQSEHVSAAIGTPGPYVNQVMLFGRHTSNGSGLPPFLDELILILSPLLKPFLPVHVHNLLFPQIEFEAENSVIVDNENSSFYRSRQAILNYYDPGEGITPHVDLLNRFGDGILGISLGSGTVMRFEQIKKSADFNVNSLNTAEEARSRHDVYLPERSIIVLTGEARYNWTHGIEPRKLDYVEKRSGEKGIADKNSWIERKKRISITLRWLLPGADIVGGD